VGNHHSIASFKECLPHEIVIPQLPLGSGSHWEFIIPFQSYFEPFITINKEHCIVSRFFIEHSHTTNSI
jgi:hypothetical protein